MTYIHNKNQQKAYFSLII